MLHGWDPGTEREIWICKGIYLNDQIGRLWNQEGFVAIRYLGDMAILVGNDFGSLEIWYGEILSRKFQG